MRALVIVNPNATSTNERTRRTIATTLRHELDLEVETTKARGHASELRRPSREPKASSSSLVLGGDGTVNEVVNGMLGVGPAPAADFPCSAWCPAATPTCWPTPWASCAIR